MLSVACAIFQGDFYGQQVMESDDVVPLTAHGISVTVITGSERHASPCIMVQVVGIKQH